MRHDDSKSIDRSDRQEDLPSERYEQPEITDYGTLTELTLSGAQPLADIGLMGGGS